MKIKKEQKNFENYLYRYSLIFLIVFSILLFILSQYLNKNFFLKFSADKELSSQTISSIQTLQFSFLVAGFLLFLLFVSLFYFESHYKLFIRKHSSIIQNTLLLIGILIFFLLIGEIFAYSTNDNNDPLMYSIEKKGVLFNFPDSILNNEGVRDRNFLITKPDNTIRIIVLGDSYTFGAGIENASDTYPKVLERKLNNFNFNKNYEVLNFGISGVDTQRELEIIKERALKYEPDFLIIGYVLNDLKNVDPEIRTFERLRLPIIGFALSRISYLYNFLESRINKVALNFGKTPYEESLKAYFNSEINKNEARKTFKEILKIAKEKEIKVLLMIFPPFYQMKNYQFQPAHEFIEEVAQENSFIFLDLLEVYKDYDEKDLQVSKHNSHPNEFGHELAAEAIFEKLKKENFIN